MSANLGNSTVPKDWKKSVFIPNSKGQCQRMFKLLYNCTHSTCFKILQARLQQYMNWELPDVQAGFRKGRETRDQIANIRWLMEKAMEFQKNIYFCIIGYAKAFDCVNHNKMWKLLQEMWIPDHLACLLRNLYAGQEATVRTGHGTRDWFQIRKAVCQGCILSPCLFNLSRRRGYQLENKTHEKEDEQFIGLDHKENFRDIWVYSLNRVVKKKTII